MVYWYSELRYPVLTKVFITHTEIYKAFLESTIVRRKRSHVQNILSQLQKNELCRCKVVISANYLKMTELNDKLQMPTNKYVNIRIIYSVLNILKFLLGIQQSKRLIEQMGKTWRIQQFPHKCLDGMTHTILFDFNISAWFTKR